jgi:ABC-type nitrate/sulfonate/bicarbonate transport system substrate-binding protein
MRLLGKIGPALMAALVMWSSSAHALPVKIASFRSFGFLPVWVAKDGGFLAREGVETEILFFSSGTEMTAALLSQSV